MGTIIGFILFFVYATLIFFINKFKILFFVFIFNIFLIFIFKINIKKIILFLFKLLPFIIFTMILNIIFSDMISRNIYWGKINFSLPSYIYF